MMKVERAPRLAYAVVARGLRKSFGDQLVLDGVDLDVAEGTVHALLGPNGSGRTTWPATRRSAGIPPTPG